MARREDGLKGEGRRTELRNVDADGRLDIFLFFFVKVVEISGIGLSRLPFFLLVILPRESPRSLVK